MDKDFSKLIQEAKKIARKRELTDYADCGHTSCALLTKKGNIYTGISIAAKCNIGNCAEHAAIAEMLKNNESEIEKMVAYSSKGIIYPPCGKCRELIRMINEKNLQTKIMVREDKIVDLEELLPEIFISKK